MNRTLLLVHQQEKANSRIARRLKIAHVLALLACLGLAHQMAGQALQPFKNYFVTGDYVVGGVGLRGLGDGTGFATGTITIPDPHTPAMSVPAGADVVAAFLYWQTVEKSQSAFAGQNGFFGYQNPDLSFSIYPITGNVLGNPNAPVSWSSGGCAGSSQGTTTLRTYRADVRPFLPVGGGRHLGNGTFSVRLADSGSNGGGTPLTLGATLVVVYRLLSPANLQNPAPLPLNAITIYDGSFAPGNTSSTMNQTIAGFYDAAPAAVAKLTHIVGNGQTNKSEQVFLNNLMIPSLYLSLPPFPGLYNGSWDNPTWTNVNQYGAIVKAKDSAVTTMVQPIDTNTGCVSWGAVVFATNVSSSSNDGLLDSWKNNRGYTDYKDTTFVPLPPAASSAGPQDIYIQVDYMCSVVINGTCDPSGHNHLPKQAALDLVGHAFYARNINVHFDVGNNYQNGDQFIVPFSANSAGGHIIAESSEACQDNPAASPPFYCQFPGEASTGWKGGFNALKNKVFPHNRKDTWHEMIFGHELGLATTSWAIAFGNLTSIVNSGNTATVTTVTPHNLSVGNRVTILGAIADFNLNGTYLIKTVPSATTFTFTTANVANLLFNNSGLSVSTGPASGASGWSDLGGGDTVITFGKWHWDDPAGCQPNPTVALAAGQVYCNDQVGSVQAQAGTIMHELGHTLGLTHGGTNITPAPPVSPNGAPGISITLGANCQPNYQSVMSYQFQIRGLPGFDGIAHVNYSGVALDPLNEGSLQENAGIGANVNTYRTRWYAPVTNNFLENLLNSTVGGRAATLHCNGTPISNAEVGTMIRLDGPLVPGPIDWNDNGFIDDLPILAQDINFNGSKADPTFTGFNDWSALDLRQIGARRGVFGFSVDVGGDISLDTGGGGDLSLDTGGGGDISLDTGGGGDLSLDTGGGGDISLDSGGGGAEQDIDMANSTVDPPVAVTVTQVGHTAVLNWSPPGFGRIRTYYIWRAATTNGPISTTNLPNNIGKVSGTPPATAFTDTSVKNHTTYTYFVTGALGSDSGPKNNGNQSGPSNLVTISIVF